MEKITFQKNGFTLQELPEEQKKKIAEMSKTLPDFTPNIQQIDLKPFMEPVEIDPIKYEDSFFKQMSDEIQKSQTEISTKIDTIIQDSAKSSKYNIRLAIATLTFAILTFIATIIGIIVSLVK